MSYKHHSNQELICQIRDAMNELQTRGVNISRWGELANETIESFGISVEDVEKIEELDQLLTYDLDKEQREEIIKKNTE